MDPPETQRSVEHGVGVDPRKLRNTLSACHLAHSNYHFSVSYYRTAILGNLFIECDTYRYPFNRRQRTTFEMSCPVATFFSTDSVLKGEKEAVFSVNAKIVAGWTSRVTVSLDTSNKQQLKANVWGCEMKNLLKRAMFNPDDLVVEFEYCDRRGRLTRRLASPIRFLGSNRFLALCLSSCEPRQFLLEGCDKIQLRRACDYVMPCEMQVLGRSRAAKQDRSLVPALAN